MVLISTYTLFNPAAYRYISMRSLNVNLSNVELARGHDKRWTILPFSFRIECALKHLITEKFAFI